MVPRYSDFVLQGRSPKNCLNSFLENLRKHSDHQVFLFFNSLDMPRRVLDIGMILRLTRFLRTLMVSLCSGPKAVSYPANAVTTKAPHFSCFVPISLGSRQYPASKASALFIVFVENKRNSAPVIE